MESVTGGDGRLAPLRPTEVTATLGGEDLCIAEARDLVADFLGGRIRTELGIPVSARALGDAQLVVSELVTNARKYAPGPVSLELRLSRNAVVVAVRDTDPVLPVARDADAHRIGQHGLEIVKAVALAFEAQREPTGKCLTATIALFDDLPPGP
ncbi:ATP-binding protein [Streptomyces sp. NPDC014748]|uniref:ATP-binding protein n=1 Tax=Streptomyces sp. NPDC014748 TaxID=3364905 RepID=UPI0036F744F7